MVLSSHGTGHDRLAHRLSSIDCPYCRTARPDSALAAGHWNRVPCLAPVNCWSKAVLFQPGMLQGTGASIVQIAKSLIDVGVSLRDNHLCIRPDLRILCNGSAIDGTTIQKLQVPSVELASKVD
jgi:hypothetical protein